MPPRSNPTARQGRLGAELRKLREAAGIPAREAADLLSASQTQVSHIESGRFGISEERVRRLASFYACDNPQLVDALVDMASERGKGWWEEYRGILSPSALDLAEAEHHGTYVRTFQAVHIPGLLQTQDHMRAASAFVAPEMPDTDREAHIAFRTRRQQILDGEATTPYEAIIHEAALRIRVGGLKAARTQLDHILEMSDRPSITIRVIPFTTDDFAGAGHSLLYIGGPVPQLDTAQIDTAHGGMLLDATAQLNRYRTRLDRIDRTALDPAESRDLIHRIAQEL